MSNEKLDGLDELFDYKNQIIGDLITNPNIVSLLTDDPALIAAPENLIYTQVFPWERAPGTTEDATTYICCEIDIKDTLNKTYLEPVIYVWVFTHDSLFRLPNGKGIRYDRLASEVAKTLNGSRMYGLGELSLYSAKKSSPIDHYQGRTLTFNALDFNRVSQAAKFVPSNRKG